MRINMNWRTSLLTRGSHEETPKWYQKLITEFLKEWDMTWENCWGEKVLDWAHRPLGVRMFSEWLQDQGYDAQYWEMTHPRFKTRDPMAYGVEINNNCPKFIQLKLGE